MKHYQHLRRTAYTALITAALTIPVHAAVVDTPDATQHDLILAVRASGGKGDTITLLVDLGSYFQFSPASQVPLGLQSTFSGATPGSTFSLDLGNLGTELARLYSSAGTDWFNRTDLTWGIIGTNSSAVKTIYASRDRLGGASSLPWPELTNDARNLTGSEITSVIYNLNGFQGREATTGSPYAAEQPDFSGASSYNSQVSGALDFGSASQWNNIEGSVNSDLDIWRLGSDGVTNAGYFSLSDGGVVSFTAIPEPSAFLLTLAGGSFLAFNRRRSTRA